MLLCSSPRLSCAAIHSHSNVFPKITQADAGTQTEEEIVQFEEKEQEEVVAKVFCLDEEHGESDDSEAHDSGWEDDDDDSEDFSD